jgi:tRNA 2-thiouridine synthesizing protein C
MIAHRRFIFLVRRPPYGGIQAQETLDLVLSAAAFDQVVTLLFLDDGVFQLKTGQRLLSPGARNISPIFAVLETYGVHDLLVESESLRERGLLAASLIVPVREIFRRDVAALIQAQDLVVSG